MAVGAAIWEGFKTQQVVNYPHYNTSWFSCQ
jgi:hypothetical protein